MPSSKNGNGFPTSRPGCIRIRTYQKGDRVRRRSPTTASASGMPVRDKIFEPFFSTKESSTDMGLGLAITYGIVKDYSGDIRLTSREGERTAFTLSFAAI